ncbi:glycosyltransferase [Roseomonas rosulenta]|uniref:glycosyltransferase n=1 Tax=Roseomonas rosulenta TaxID=2748667 RepID=UPI0018DF02CD|nr:glycosyltransferase [Roseomonas rosulenta]
MRILQLSSHTTLLPIHGGKLRSHHIGRVIEREPGFNLRRLALTHRSPDDLDDPREPIVDIGRSPYWGSDSFCKYGVRAHYFSEFLFSAAVLETPDILAEFNKRVCDAAPDLIILEHPWTWPLLARLEKVQSGIVPLVYSSQNVEINIKRSILDRECIEFSSELRNEVLDEIEALERGLVAHAAGVVACTASDGAVFSEWGARRVVVAPNGGAQRDRELLIDLLPRPIEPWHAYALVVGSAHPPNISGFLDLVVPFLPLLQPNQRIVVAGDAGLAIRNRLEERGLSTIIRDRLIVLGRVDGFTLDCVIANAQVIMVPILYGGGSNVKTAEALLSGRPVLATGHAMRGFDDFHHLPGLTIADDAAGFGEAMLDALALPFPASSVDHAAVAPLLWESTIAPFVALLRGIDQERQSRQGSATFAVEEGGHRP